MREKKIKEIGLALCFLLLFLVIRSGRMETYPFKPGEKLTYTVKWSGASFLVELLVGKSVAKLVLEVEKKLTQINERPAYHFSWELRTTGLFPSLFFPVEERRESYVDINTLYPCKVVIYYEEKKNLLKDWIIEINQKTGETLIRDKKNEGEETKFFPSPIFDMPSLIYWLRTQKLEVGKVFPLFLLEEVGTESGKQEIKEGKVQIKVATKEEIYIDEKPYLTFLCEEINSEKSEKIKVWFSADEKHLPLKIELPAGEGTVIAEIVQ